MIKAIFYKEWIKMRCFYPLSALFLFGATAYALLRVQRVITFKGAAHVWEVMLEKEVVFIDILQYLPALLGAFALGPVYGVVISFMKNLLHIVIKGTSTACVGELCNFMLGAVFSAVAGFIYKHRKSRKTAILGAIAGAAAMAVFSVPSNYFITYPAYVEFYHMPLEAILGMYQAILPSANSLIKCLVIFNMPFTLVKGLLDAVLCMVIYKPLSPILHGRK